MTIICRLLLLSLRMVKAVLSYDSASGQIFFLGSIDVGRPDRFDRWLREFPCINRQNLLDFRTRPKLDEGHIDSNENTKIHLQLLCISV